MANGTVLSETKDTVSILTYGSVNRKTGNMDQTWHLYKHLHPVLARQLGLDKAVCFDCPLAGNKGCYVDIGKSAAGVWGAWRRGAYDSELRLGRPVRFGAYGDPCLIPLGVATFITSAAPVFTGFTHRWREPAVQPYKEFFMASVDSLAEHRQASAQGWKTFRTVRDYTKLDPRESVCLNYTKGILCVDCGMCSGNKAHMVLKAHGQLKKRLPCWRELQGVLQW